LGIEGQAVKCGEQRRGEEKQGGVGFESEGGGRWEEVATECGRR